MLEKISYVSKVEFDFDENGKFIAAFFESEQLILEDGQQISRKVHREVVSFARAHDFVSYCQFMIENGLTKNRIQRIKNENDPIS